MNWSNGKHIIRDEGRTTGDNRNQSKILSSTPRAVGIKRCGATPFLHRENRTLLPSPLGQAVRLPFGVNLLAIDL